MGFLVLGGFIAWMAGCILVVLVVQEALIRLIGWKYRCGTRKEAEAKWDKVSGAVLAFFWLLWVAITFWYGGGRNFYYDAKIDRLCAVDGGIKVYETVKLPEDQFDKWGDLKFYDQRRHESALGPEYIFRSTNSYFRKGSPRMRQDHVQIFRKQDMRLLGEVITYVRSGGDHPFTWIGSAYRCPEAVSSTILIRKIFTK
ncbi:MAG: hypothetical protein LBL72_01225 [Candidatus Accumulibacter sp.]|nr:hypothetical protein [Accumulibacter sp.]